MIGEKRETEYSMTFLQPFILWGLPLALLPVLIHLINRMRYRSLPWAAMMFLVSANRSSTRFAQLRQILILCCRILAVLGLILALSRPLAGGWLGWMLAPAPDAILILLDRSTSMESRDSEGSSSKRVRALQLLSQASKEFDDTSRLALLESVLRTPQEIASGTVLPELSMVSATDTAADVPAMLQAAVDWLVENRVGTSEIWIASDLQRNNWKPESDRWPALVSRLASLPQGVRVRLLALNEGEASNASLFVHETDRKRRGEETELDVILDIQRNSSLGGALPLSIIVNGARSQKDLVMEGQTLRFHHKINLGLARGGGWGQVGLPSDANARDNAGYFVYGPEIFLRAVAAVLDVESRRYLQLAVAPSSKELKQGCALISPGDDGKLGAVNLHEIALALWQGPLPQGEGEQQLRVFVEEGGVAIFFPPGRKDSQEFLGAGWGEVQVAEREKPFRVMRWEENDGPLTKTEEGLSLPVSELVFQRRQVILGGKSALASFEGGEPFLTRHAAGRGQVFFCASLPKRDWSSLREGSVLVPMLQRLLQAGGRRLSVAPPVPCGEWKGLDFSERWISVDSTQPKDIRFQAGVYRQKGRLVAVNRPLHEDDRESMEAGAVRSLFGDIPIRMFQEQQAASTQPHSEMWRFFLFFMLLFLLAEAVLILPAAPSKSEAA